MGVTLKPCSAISRPVPSTKACVGVECRAPLGGGSGAGDGAGVWVAVGVAVGVGLGVAVGVGSGALAAVRTTSCGRFDATSSRVAKPIQSVVEVVSPMLTGPAPVMSGVASHETYVSDE